MDITIGSAPLMPPADVPAAVQPRVPHPLSAAVVRTPVSFTTPDRPREAAGSFPLYTRAADKVEVETTLRRGGVVDVTG